MLQKVFWHKIFSENNVVACFQTLFCFLKLNNRVPWFFFVMNIYRFRWFSSFLSCFFTFTPTFPRLQSCCCHPNNRVCFYDWKSKSALFFVVLTQLAHGQNSCERFIHVSPPRSAASALSDIITFLCTSISASRRWICAERTIYSW